MSEESGSRAIFKYRLTFCIGVSSKEKRLQVASRVVSLVRVRDDEMGLEEHTLFVALLYSGTIAPFDHECWPQAVAYPFLRSHMMIPQPTPSENRKSGTENQICPERSVSMLNFAFMNKAKIEEISFSFHEATLRRM